MNAVRIAIACAGAALVVGAGLSHLSPDARDGLVATARAMVGGSGAAPENAANASGLAPIGPASSQAVSGLAEVVAPDPRGQWQTTVEIEGERLPVLIDTGATFLALSFEDADRLGIRPAPADFRLPINTANGRTTAAPVRLRSVRLGGIEVHDVSAIVAGRGQMSGTLLGMSFLSRLSGVAVDHGALVLRE